MVKILLVLNILLFSASNYYAQSAIPQFKGINLNDEVVSFPDDLSDKKSMIGFAFSRKSQEELESWAQPVYDEFIDKESLASLVYDVNVYLVIVFNKTNSSFRKKVEKELKENILTEFYSNIVLSEEDARVITEVLTISETDTPTILTLNKEGGITSTTRGFYSSKKMEKLSSFLEIEE